MANNNLMSSLFLRLQNNIGEEDENSNPITEDIYLNKTQSSTLVSKILDNETLTVSATHIQFHSAMYEPDHYVACIKVNGTGMSMATLADKLMGLRATIMYINEDNEASILSKNLFVYQAIPSIDNNNSDTIRVRLEIYSTDKLLDLQKFSRAFTGQSISDTILTNEALDAFIPVNSKGTTMYELSTKHNLQVLGYKANDKSCEVIQPYLAQYNETFRSMLNRTTNRCGEFLYWFDGALQYGLHDESEPMTLDGDTATITMSGLPTSRFETLNVNETHRNGKKGADFSECGEVNYDIETGMPDFNETVKFAYGSDRKHDKTHYLADTYGFKFINDTNNEKYGDIDWESSDFKKFVIGNFLTKYAKTGNFFDFVSDIVTDSLVTKMMENVESFGKNNDAKRNLNLKRLISKDEGDTFGFKKFEQTNFGVEWNDEEKQYGGDVSSIQDYDKLESNLKISPFSTLGAIMEDSSKLLDNNVLSSGFYSKVRTMGKKAAANAIDITMRSNAMPAYIGQRIKIKDDTYVITAISGSCQSQKDSIIKEDEQNIKIEIETCIHAIPASEVNGKSYYLPEPLPEHNRKMDGNCTAYISDTDDPYGQGRVRVRFSWQGKNKVELNADEKKSCYEEALEKVYKQGSADKNEKNYEDDQNNFLYKYRDVFSKEILDRKKNNDKLAPFEKKLVLNTDEIEIYEFKQQFYPKTIAEKKVAEANEEATKQGWAPVFSACKVASPDGKPQTYAEIAKIISRLQKVDKYIDVNENDALVALEKSENLKDSTPWIRMASPMAGNATFYMQPSAGDEVIIGFENGNPERPYVLGSLFNGSSKSPGGFGVTMANGHGISLEDEDLGVSDIIGSLLSPLAKNVMDRISDNANDDEDDEASKYHVGGKVSIKDKYGFYSLSMSSADREVNIKCPLGNISLSAFTGITISAPNGDINIMGKNVNITAGDRLTLKSGTNKDIKDADKSDVNGILKNALTQAASAAIDNVLGDIKVVDMSTARAAWEVVFRPINGTLSIHSNRHLLLEAGKGNAEMPVDTMQASTPVRALQSFPNYHFFLLQNFMDGLNDDYVNKMSALQNAYDEVRLAVSKKRTKSNIETEDDTPTVHAYNQAIRNHQLNENEAKSVLSDEKLTYILKHGLADKSGKWVVDESKVMAFCPFPDVSEHKDKVDAWKNLVIQTTRKVADLKNIHTSITNWNLKNEPAVKAFIKVMNDSLEKGNLWATVSGKMYGGITKKHAISEADFGDAEKFIKYIKCTKGINSTAVAVDFDIDRYVGATASTDNYEFVTISGTRNFSVRDIQYNIIKVLHKLELVKLVVKDEAVVSGKSKYHTTDMPDTASDAVAANRYESWSNFLNHIVPASDVDDQSILGSIVEGIGEFFNDKFSDAVDYENMNWMLGTERRVWNTKAHAGLILMSSENGSSTAVLDKDSKLTQNKNHSLNSLMSHMAEKDARPTVQDSKSIEEKITHDWTQEV